MPSQNALASSENMASCAPALAKAQPNSIVYAPNLPPASTG